MAGEPGGVDKANSDNPMLVLISGILLLGGIASAAGPLLGALALTGISTEVNRLMDYWQLVLGALILVLALGAPGGLSGLLRPWSKRDGAS